MVISIIWELCFLFERRTGPSQQDLLTGLKSLTWTYNSLERLVKEDQSQCHGSQNWWGGWGHACNACRKVGTFGGNAITVGSSSNRWVKLSSDNQKWGQHKHHELSLAHRVALSEQSVSVREKAGRARGQSVCPHPRSDHHPMVWINSLFLTGAVFLPPLKKF